MKFLKFLREFVENDSNTPTLYKDSNVEIKVVKTLDASILQNKNTGWCSSYKSGFYSHNKTANMYRFNFSDGYKLRLTWDYIVSKASELGTYSGGTHWGQGGILDGKKMYYDVLRPKDNDEPFLFYYDKKDKSLMIDRIESIPQKAIDSVHKYQEKLSREKSERINKTYQNISNIKITKITLDYSTRVTNNFNVYLSDKNIDSIISLEVYIESNNWSLNIINFKSKDNYINVGGTLYKYLKDKVSEFIKKNNIDLFKAYKNEDDEDGKDDKDDDYYDDYYDDYDEDDDE